MSLLTPLRVHETKHDPRPAVHVPRAALPGFDVASEVKVFPLTKTTGERLSRFVTDYGAAVLKASKVEPHDIPRVVTQTAELLERIGTQASSIQEPREKVVTVGTIKSEVTGAALPRTAKVTEPAAAAEERLKTYEETHTINGTPAVLAIGAIAMAEQDPQLDPIERSIAADMLAGVKEGQKNFKLL
jgi:hypothetical protein